MLVTAALRMDSCAPIPTPQSAMPSSSMGTELNENTNTANGAEMSVDHTRAFTPFLSYIMPKMSAATASTSIAPAYSSGSVPELTREEVSDSPEVRAEYVRETCMMMIE